MTTFEMVSTVVGGFLAFFGTTGVGYKAVVYWRKSEREAGRAEQYRISSTETIEDLRARLVVAESRPSRCQTCPLWQQGNSP